VPGAGASVTSFVSLVSALGERTTVYGLQPRGLDGNAPPHSTVEGAARCYIEALRTILPHGPYRLIGHSFGGWVVFEMACQLAAAGDKLETLVLLDCQPPTADPKSAKLYDHTGAVLKLAWLLEEGTGKSLGIARRDIERLGDQEQQRKLMQQMKLAGQFPQSAKLAELESLIRVFTAHLNTTYVPTTMLQGAALLLQAQEPFVRHEIDVEDDLDNDAAAKSWTTHAGRLTRAVVPGNHMTMLKPPNIDVIATYLRKVWPDQ
jgi:thioesterase domain-containing protein